MRSFLFEEQHILRSIHTREHKPKHVIQGRNGDHKGNIEDLIEICDSK